MEELAGEERKDLEAHLTQCSQCRSEQQAYQQTLRQLAFVENEDVPRHFFIYPEEKALSPWNLFRRMSPGWQA